MIKACLKTYLLNLSLARPGDWTNFYFLDKFLNNLGRFFLGNILFFAGQKRKIDYFWADFYHRPALVFKVSALGHKYPVLDA